MQEANNTEIPLATLFNLRQSQQHRNRQEEENMSPESAIKAISMIFADPPEDLNKESSFSPQARVILLTILLCSTVLAMYTIFESFIDTIILAVLSGIAYVRLRERFVAFMKKSRIQQLDQRSLFLRFCESVAYIVLIVILPEIRYLFSSEFEVRDWKSLLYIEIDQHLLHKALTVFIKTNNIIRLVQIYLLIKIVINLFGNALHRLYFFVKQSVAKLLLKRDNSKARMQSFLHSLFIVVFLLAIVALSVIFAGLFFEFSSMVSSVGRTIEKYNNCTFYSLEDSSEQLSQCSQTITGTLRSYLPTIQKKDEVAKCIDQLEQKQLQYLNFTLFEHKKQACLIYQIVKEQSPQLLDSLFDLEVTKEYMLALLRNLLRVLALTSDTIFSLTTFVSIFIMTVKSYTASEQRFYLFGEHQNQLMSNITNLIYDYIMVTVKHILFSLVVFEVFRFSDFNIVLSLVVGGVTLFPLISVSMVVLIMSAVKYYFTSSDNQIGAVSAAVCCVVFWIGSGRIFKEHFNKMDFNNTLVSLSAVFGLYRFGVAGIFYGPLVILLFICAYDALGRSKI